MFRNVVRYTRKEEGKPQKTRKGKTMKHINKIFTAIIITLVLVSIGFPAMAEEYPTCGIVVEINEEENLVFVEDFNGNVWAFEGIEDWFIGDICAMIMDDMDTETIYDDEIVMVRCCGWLED